MDDVSKISFAPLDLSWKSDIPDREQVAAYLEAGATVRVAIGSGPDEVIQQIRDFIGPDYKSVSNEWKRAVSIGTATDGTFIWPLGMGYYVQKYGVGAGEELLTHIRANNYVTPAVSEETLDALRMRNSIS